MTRDKLRDATLTERAIGETVAALKGLERVNLMFFPAAENYSGNTEDRIRIELNDDEVNAIRRFLLQRKLRLDGEFEAL